MSLKPAERYEKTGTTKPSANVGLCFIQLVFLYKYTLSTSICLAGAYVIPWLGVFCGGETGRMMKKELSKRWPTLSFRF